VDSCRRDRRRQRVDFGIGADLTNATSCRRRADRPAVCIMLRFNRCATFVPENTGAPDPNCI
jgi:hypothetical protein